MIGELLKCPLSIRMAQICYRCESQAAWLEWALHTDVLVGVCMVLIQDGSPHMNTIQIFIFATSGIGIVGKPGGERRDNKRPRREKDEVCRLLA